MLKSGFKYDQATEKYLENLEKLAKLEGYYDETQEEFANLRKKLQHNLEKDLEFNRQTLKKYISNDIIPAYYFQKGAIINALRGDKQMDEALRILNAPDEYRSILEKPKK